jgi:hypothetical protein
VFLVEDCEISSRSSRTNDKSVRQPGKSAWERYLIIPRFFPSGIAATRSMMNHRNALLTLVEVNAGSETKKRERREGFVFVIIQGSPRLFAALRSIIRSSQPCVRIAPTHLGQPSRLSSAAPPFRCGTWVAWAGLGNESFTQSSVKSFVSYE